MAEPITALKSAGFDDQEIAAWSAEKRGTLTAAGFQENEIEAYFSGGVTVSDGAPRALVERFLSADGFADAVQSVDKAIGGDVITRIGSAMREGAAAGFGESPIGLEAEDIKKLQDIGLFRKPGAPYNLASGLQFANEAMIRPSVAAIATVFRGANAAIYGLGAGAAQLGAEVTGANEAEAARARREGAQFASIATILAGAQPMARLTRSPTGEIHREVIGTLPKSQDFVDAAKVVGGDTRLPVQEKLLEIYQDRGVLPSEVVEAAQRDPVLKQQLLSSDPKDMPIKPPSGEVPPPPPKEPPPPKPPEPGSFEEAQAKVLEKVSIGDREPGKYSWSKFYTQAIDDLHPIKAVSEDAYEMARLTRGQFGKAEHFIEHGTFDFGTYKTTGKPLREIMEPIKDDLDGFRAFLTSKRALEVEATGRKSGIDLAAAQRVASDGEARFGAAAKDLLDYQNSLLKYLRDAGVLSDKAFGAMVQASESYIPFYRVFFPEKVPPSSKGFGPGNPVKALEGSDRGIIDPLESIIKNTYAYVSVAERNAVGIKLIDALKEQGLKAATKTPKYEGGEAKLVDYLKQNGVHDAEALVDFVKASAADEGTAISAWRAGKRESVETNDAELVKAFRGMDEQSVGLLTKVLAVPAKTLRAGATLTPDFMARNLIRDFQTAIVNSKGLFSPIDTAKGLAGVITKDADFMNWLKAGGANSTFVALDRRYMQESLASLTKETGLGNRAWNVVQHPLETVLAPLRMMSELMENATRLGEFKKVAGTDLGKEALQSAAYASREVTLDFARIGARMRAYNMVTAFANAQIQGVDRIGRAFADRPVNTTAKIAGAITLPSVLLWWANHGDQRYDELPDWQKDLFWIVLTDKWEKMSPADAAGKPAHLVRGQGDKTEFNNGHIWRIPKPFELGIVFGSGVERALSATIGKDKEAFKGFTKSVVEAFTPGFIPTAVQPVFEQWANRSTFTDRTLIPADVEKHLPEYQYTPYTTELAKSLGQIFSAFPGMREASVEQGNVAGPASRALTTPILIENYVRSWTGGLGMYALQAADLSLRKAGVLPDPVTPTPTLADIPFVRAFAVRYPSATTESIQRFYDEHGRNKRYFDTWMAKAQEGDATALEHIQKAGGPQMFLQLDEIRSTLTEHSKLIRDIYRHPKMEGDEKRQLIDSLYFNMIQIGQGGRQILKQSTEALAPQ